MSRLLKIFATWIPLAVVVTAFCAMGYVLVQQVLRQDANDPQIQMAEDAALSLSGGANVDTFMPKEQVEISRSLAPFIVIYDGSGKAIASSGLLGGKMPDYPIGALEAAKGTGENRVTWQPQGGVRIASVAVPFQGGYVVAGRNMREVEARENQMQALAGFAWVGTLVATFLAVAVTSLL